MNTTFKTTPGRKLIVYGTERCPTALLARRYLEAKAVDFEWVDINYDAEGRAFVIAHAGGNATVPTFRFPNGEVLVEPNLKVLKQRLGIEDHSLMERLRSRLGT